MPVVLVCAAVVVAAGLATWTLYRRVDPLSYGTYWVPSPAMEPTHSVDDIVRIRDIDGSEADRGDVIILDLPTGPGGEVLMSIKRVIAVGGDEVAPGPDGTVLVNGSAIDEPYLAEGEVTEGIQPVTVPAGHLYVLGDNRDQSADSRMTGPAPEADVLSVVLD